MTDFNLIVDALAALRDDDVNSATVFIEQFVTLNTPNSRYSLKIYDWVATDDIRPQLTGVYHDWEAQRAVASNTHVLIASKNDYRENCAGKIIKRDGDEARGTFPNWGRVFPNNLIEHHEVAVDRARIKDLLKQIKVERRVDSSARYKGIRIERGIYLTPEYCKLLLTLPDGKFYAKDGNHAIVYYSADCNYHALLYPIRVDESQWEHELIPE